MTEHKVEFSPAVIAKYMAKPAWAEFNDWTHEQDPDQNAELQHFTETGEVLNTGAIWHQLAATLDSDPPIDSVYHLAAEMIGIFARPDGYHPQHAAQIARGEWYESPPQDDSHHPPEEVG